MPEMTTGTMTQRYWVVYMVEGFGSRLAGPYPGILETREEHNDIAGYEGVFSVLSMGPYEGTESEPEALLKLMSDNQLKLVMEN